MVNWRHEGGESSTIPERRIFGISSRDNALFLPEGTLPAIFESLRVFNEGGKIGIAPGEAVSPEAKELWRTLTFFERATKEWGSKKRGDRKDTFYQLLNFVFSAQTGEEREIEVAREVLGKIVQMKFREKKNDPVKKAFSCLEELAKGKTSADVIRVLEFFYWLNEAREGKGDWALATIEQARTKHSSLI